MAWLKSIVLALAAIAVVYADIEEDGVELEFHPSGPHKAGDNIKVVCRAKAGEVLDLVKIVKQVGDTEYEITTNDFMKPLFMETGRYAMQWSKTDEFKTGAFSIKKAKGEDSGLIVCKHVLLDHTTYEAQEEFKVLVPPKSVALKHYRNGVERTVDDEKIILREGEDSGIECAVVMDGSLDSPQTTITLDGEDAMHFFSKEENKTSNPNNGLVQMKSVTTYEYLFAQPDLSLNGKTLTCNAEVELFDALSSSATIEVHYKPRLECTAVGAELGESVILKCTGRMNPGLDLVSVSWKRKPDMFTLTQTDPNTYNHHLNVTDNNDGSYEFAVIIDEVKEGDFGNYKFEVQNAHASEEIKLKLIEEVRTTTSTTTTTTTMTTTTPVVAVTVPTTEITRSNKPVTAQGNELPDPGAVGKASMTQSLSLLCLIVAAIPFLML